MDPEDLVALVTELSESLPVKAADEQARAIPPDSPGLTPGWHVFAPADGGPQLDQPLSPWRHVDVLGVAGAWPLVVVTLLWRPTGQVFAHVSDTSDWADVPDAAGLQIELAITRGLEAGDTPQWPRSLTVGEVTVVPYE
jgi:hypothetical protein